MEVEIFVERIPEEKLREIDEIDDKIREAIARGDRVKEIELEKEWDKLFAKMLREERRKRREGVIFVGPQTALAEIGLVSFVVDFIMRLSYDYEVVPPVFEFRDTGRYYATFFANRITLHIGFIDAYEKDPIATRAILRYILAHEFWHYLQIARHIPIPLPKSSKWKSRRKILMEAKADEFAMAATGLGQEEMRRLARKLLL